MNHPAISTTLHYRSIGFKTLPNELYGRKIVNAELRKDDEALVLSFEDGLSVQLQDYGQRCCEVRYLTCDDDLSRLVGGVLTRIELKEAQPIQDDDGDVHEQMFVEVATNECFVTVCTHNEHNGYYGGFDLGIDVIGLPQTARGTP